MRYLLPLAVFVLLSCTDCLGDEKKLYQASVNQKSKKGKDLIMTLKELERKDKYSIIRVKYTSGASVPSILFIVKGFYHIAKIRGEKYFINLKEWRNGKHVWMYKIGFASDNTVDPKKYFGPDIDLKKRLQFLSVADYDKLWGKKVK